MPEHLIPQYAISYVTFQDYQKGITTDNPFSDHYRELEVTSALDFQQLFIIAEPGYGKTTFIDRVRDYFRVNKISFIYQNGKDYEKNSNPPIEVTSYYLLDALDESSDVVSTFRQITDYCKIHGLKLIISNRSHYLQQLSHILVEFEFAFIELQAFSENQISRYLTLHLAEKPYSDEDIELIIHKSKANSAQSILSVPRYLKAYTFYIIHNDLGPDQVKSVTKSELFDKVVYFKLENEINPATDRKIDSNQKYLTKRVLERLALVMEIHSLNQISKEEFITFLDQTDSNISLIFLGSGDLDFLLERVMKSTGEMLQFENTEIQEYLAAKELTRLGHRFQNVSDLMIEPTLQLLGANWIDVLNFAIDLEPEFARPLITFIHQQKNRSIDQKLVEVIMQVDPEKFDQPFKDFLFDTVFSYHAVTHTQLFTLHEKLAGFLSNERVQNFSPLYTPAKLADPVVHIQSNQILLLESLAKQGKLSKPQKTAWTKYLLQLIDQDRFYTLHNTAYYAIIALSDPAPLLSQLSIFEKKEDYLLNNYISALTKIDPNSPDLIKLLQRSLIKRRRLDDIDTAINHISTEQGILAILATLTRSTQALSSSTFQYGLGFYGLFGTIKKLSLKTIDRTLERFTLKVLRETTYTHHLPKIMQQSLRYLAGNNQGFIKKVIKLEHFPRFADEFISPIIKHISLESFQWIEQVMLNANHSWRLSQLIYKVKYELSQHTTNPIYSYIDEKYLKPWSKATLVSEPVKEKSALEEMRSYISDDPKLYYPKLIPFYLEKSEELNPVLEQKDKQEIAKVIAMVLRNYKPEQFQMHIQEIGENRTRFSHNHDEWFSIQSYFKAAYLLSEFQLLDTYRTKFLKSIPCFDIYDTERRDIFKKILNQIGPITPNDVKVIHDYCIKRKDDLLELNARSLADVARTFNLYQLNPVLLKLINNGKIEGYDKQEVIKAFGELSRGDKYKKQLQNIFDAQKNTYQALANAALITNYRDSRAIDWRFEQLKQRAKPFNNDHRYNGTRGVSAFENELDRPEFPNCLYGIDLPQIRSKMLDLLEYSFTLRKDKLYFSYSTYLQQAVYSYYKTYITPDTLALLRKTAMAYPIAEQTYSFNRQLDQLAIDLQSIRKQPIPFISAIKGLNQILHHTYLPINSHLELKEFLLKLIRNDVQTLIEDQGFYRVIQELQQQKPEQPKKESKGPITLAVPSEDTISALPVLVNESIIQKTLKIALEKLFLENGLRKTDIQRELQSYDDLRYDYLINYGLYGPIMVELKLLHNQEITDQKKRDKYKTKLKKYLQANNGLGLYLIFQLYPSKALTGHFQALVNEYQDLSGLEIILIKCFDENQATKKITKRKSTVKKTP